MLSIYHTDRIAVPPLSKFIGWQTGRNEPGGNLRGSRLDCRKLRLLDPPPAFRFHDLALLRQNTRTLSAAVVASARVSMAQKPFSRTRSNQAV